MAHRLMLAFFLALLAVSGCRSTEHTAHSERTGGAPHRPHPVVGGFLLQTGHIQLGPRTGQNAVRWLGDGQNWLEFSGSRDHAEE